MATRTAETNWTGGLRDGSGTVIEDEHASRLSLDPCRYVTSQPASPLLGTEMRP